MVDRCVCCGEMIPEGRMICLDCEKNPTMIARKNKERDKNNSIIPKDVSFLHNQLKSIM